MAQPRKSLRMRTSSTTSIGGDYQDDQEGTEMTGLSNGDTISPMHSARSREATPVGGGSKLTLAGIAGHLKKNYSQLQSSSPEGSRAGAETIGSAGGADKNSGGEKAEANDSKKGGGGLGVLSFKNVQRLASNVELAKNAFIRQKKDLKSLKRKSVDSQTAEDKQLLEALEKQQKQKFKKKLRMNMLNVVFYFLFAIVYLLFIYISMTDVGTFYQNSYFKEFIVFDPYSDLPPESFNDISSMDDFLQWVETAFVATIFDNELLEFSDYIRTSPVVIRQVRGDGDDYFEDTFGLGTTMNITGSEVWGPKYGGYVYMTEEELTSGAFEGQRDIVYPGGGYVKSLPPFTTMDDAAILLNETISGWIDNKTRAVFCDFVVRNVRTKLFTIGRFMFEFPVSGGVYPSYYIGCVLTLRWYTYIMIGFNVGFIFTVIGVEIYRLVKRRRLKKEDRKKDKEEPKYFELRSKQTFWFAVDIIMTFMFMLMIGLYLSAASFFGPPERRQSLFHAGSGSGRDDDLGNATHPALTEGAVARVENMELLRFICGVLAFVIIAKSLDYLHHIVPIIGVPFDAFTQAGLQMLGFLLVIGTLTMGMAIGCLVMFQGTNKNFRDLGSSGINLLRSLSGDYQLDEFVNSWYRNLGPVTVIVFVLIMIYIILTMFIAIVTEGYDSSKKIERTTLYEHILAFDDNRLIKKLVRKRQQKSIDVDSKPSPFKEATLHGHTSEVDTVCVSHDGNFIASAGVDGSIKVWDAINRRELVTLEGHRGPVTSLTITPDNKHIISSSKDYTIRMWNLGLLKSRTKSAAGQASETVMQLARMERSLLKLEKTVANLIQANGNGAEVAETPSFGPSDKEKEKAPTTKASASTPESTSVGMNGVADAGSVPSLLPSSTAYAPPSTLMNGALPTVVEGREEEGLSPSSAKAESKGISSSSSQDKKGRSEKRGSAGPPKLTRKISNEDLDGEDGGVGIM